MLNSYIWNFFTASKQMIDIKKNNECKGGTFETILMCANKWLKRIFGIL